MLWEAPNSEGAAKAKSHSCDFPMMTPDEDDNDDDDDDSD